MKVFKFGGASVKNAEAIRNVGNIIKEHGTKNLLIVVSAMGKTTNAMEKIVSLMQAGQSFISELKLVISHHKEIASTLLSNPQPILLSIRNLETELKAKSKLKMEYDQTYDQIVSFGELLSTQIISAHLSEVGILNQWIDARNYLITNNHYREALVNWKETEKKIKSLQDHLDKKIIVTQGFIAATSDGSTTTLGREGSDFSAAIFASCLNAESVTIWKDVPGVMTADPKRIANVTVFEELPFHEAAEMTYYGASVIHPKTIKPLANKKIPLLVKNFDDTSIKGTRIHECKIDQLKPLMIFKENQCLISCHVTDYTFVEESQIGVIFNALSSKSLKINLMQNSAISFSFCLDFEEQKINPLIEELGKNFEVYYNTDLTLITVKNYDSEKFEEIRKLEGVILEQSSRSTLQVLVKS